MPVIENPLSRQARWREAVLVVLLWTAILIPQTEALQRWIIGCGLGLAFTAVTGLLLHYVPGSLFLALCGLFLVFSLIVQYQMIVVLLASLALE
jgi:hypothetical protein